MYVSKGVHIRISTPRNRKRKLCVRFQFPDIGENVCVSCPPRICWHGTADRDSNSRRDAFTLHVWTPESKQCLPGLIEVNENQNGKHSNWSEGRSWYTKGNRRPAFKTSTKQNRIIFKLAAKPRSRLSPHRTTTNINNSRGHRNASKTQLNVGLVQLPTDFYTSTFYNPVRFMVIIQNSSA